jgi:hypothetical protein
MAAIQHNSKRWRSKSATGVNAVPQVAQATTTIIPLQELHVIMRCDSEGKRPGMGATASEAGCRGETRSRASEAKSPSGQKRQDALRECAIIEPWRFVMKIEILLVKLAAPARRALLNADIKTLEGLAKRSESEILGLHGIGKNAKTVIKASLAEHGLSLKA